MGESGAGEKRRGEVTLTQGMKRPQKQEQDAAVVKRPRLSTASPKLPRINDDVHSIYFMIVSPWDETARIEPEVVAAVMPGLLDEEIQTPSWWQHEKERNEVKSWLSVLAFARTCKHAAHWLRHLAPKLKHLVRHTYLSFREFCLTGGVRAFYAIHAIAPTMVAYLGNLEEAQEMARRVSLPSSLAFPIWHALGLQMLPSKPPVGIDDCAAKFMIPKQDKDVVRKGVWYMLASLVRPCEVVNRWRLNQWAQQHRHLAAYIALYLHFDFGLIDANIKNTNIRQCKQCRALCDERKARSGGNRFYWACPLCSAWIGWVDDPSPRSFWLAT